jgi:hypothetical protein
MILASTTRTAETPPIVLVIQAWARGDANRSTVARSSILGGQLMRSSVGLSLSVVCSAAALACGGPPLSTGSGSAAGAGVAGSASGTAGATSGTAGATGSAGATTASGAGKFSDVCLAQADCSRGLECYCGICSTPCTPGGCSGLPVAATCPSGIPLTSACVLPVGSDCVIECTLDSDCRSLGPTAVCTVGWCRRPLLVTVVDGTALTCADRAGQMKAQLDPVVASADRACMTEADCVRVYLGNTCYGDGCSGVAVSMAGAATIAAELAALQDKDCDASFRAGCVGPGITSCPAQFNPICLGNQCQIIAPHPP